METTLLVDRSVDNLARHFGHYMQVTLKDGGGVRNGYLYTLDPTSGNLILLQQQSQPAADAENDNDAAIVIMHHAIESIAVEPNLPQLKMEDMDGWFGYNQDQYRSDAPWILERRDAFVAYLEKSRIPFRHELDDPVIHVLGRARVEPPYVATSVISDNNVIRDRVREMIMNLF